MKSKTYQKEGWFILEEESSVFGFDAGNEGKFDSEKNAIFIIENKEEIQNKIDISSKDLTDFFDALSKDIPEPSKEEIDSGIAKILERTHPEAVKSEPSRTSKSKKVTFRVLFIAALLSALSFTCLFAVGNNHNISIENGFATFAKDTVKVVFFGESEEKYISVNTLLSDLENHGYKDILFPEEFINNSDMYKVSVPKYTEEELKQVSFDVYNDTSLYSFVIHNTQSRKSIVYFKLDDAKTLNVDDVLINIFEFNENSISLEFSDNKYMYYINASAPYSEIIEVAKTIK